MGPKQCARLRVPDGPLTLGIRPEHHGLAAADTGVSFELAGRVDFLEWLGAEKLVHLARAPEGDEPSAAAPLVALTAPRRTDAPLHRIARLDPAAPRSTACASSTPDSDQRRLANTGDNAYAPG